MSRLSDMIAPSRRGTLVYGDDDDGFIAQRQQPLPSTLSAIGAHANARERTRTA